MKEGLVEKEERESDCLELLHLPQPPDGGPDGGGDGGGVVPRSAGDGDAAVLLVAEPDAHGLTLHVLLE